MLGPLGNKRKWVFKQKKNRTDFSLHTKVKQEFRDGEKEMGAHIILMHGLRKTKGKHKAPVILNNRWLSVLSDLFYGKNPSRNLAIPIRLL